MVHIFFMWPLLTEANFHVEWYSPWPPLLLLVHESSGEIELTVPSFGWYAASSGPWSFLLSMVLLPVLIATIAWTTPLQNQGGYERWWWAEGKSVGTKCSYRSKARWISTHSIPSIWKEEEKNRKGEVRSYAVVYSKHFPPSWTSSH